MSTSSSPFHVIFYTSCHHSWHQEYCTTLGAILGTSSRLCSTITLTDGHIYASGVGAAFQEWIRIHRDQDKTLRCDYITRISKFSISGASGINRPGKHKRTIDFLRTPVCLNPHHLHNGRTPSEGPRAHQRPARHRRPKIHPPCLVERKHCLPSIPSVILRQQWRWSGRHPRHHQQTRPHQKSRRGHRLVISSSRVPSGRHGL